MQSALARGKGALLSLGMGLSALVVSSEAHAFCRTRTCEFVKKGPCPTDPVTGCSTLGAFVYWGSSCLSYAVQRDGSAALGIRAEQISSLLEQGFLTWSDLSCPGGGSPELAAASQGLIACDEVEYNCLAGDANSNLVTFRDDFIDDPEGRGLRFGVIAVTAIIANLKTGEILDADIELNSRDENFTLTDSTTPGVRNLHGVINHELGHLLGLSHTRERGALMRALYEGTLEPAQDDTAGICQALGKSSQDPACVTETLPSDSVCLGHDVSCTEIETPAPEPDGCACRQARTAPGRFGLWALGCGLLVLARGRRSRSGQTVL
jgi:hypothetical protein